VKSFTTGQAPQERLSDQMVTFLHDGRTVTAHPPTVAQYALFIAAYESLDTDISGAVDIINFFFCLWGPEDYEYFKDRIFERTDPFDLHGEGGMTDILASVLAVWSRPAPLTALSH
jgi:hypothetical protein